jgi:hypothetical protein
MIEEHEEIIKRKKFNEKRNNQNNFSEIKLIFVIDMFLSEEHSSKRIFLINLTEFGIKILIRDEYLKKH